jgi:hypothetical protein
LLSNLYDFLSSLEVKNRLDQIKKSPEPDFHIGDDGIIVEDMEVPISRHALRRQTSTNKFAGKHQELLLLYQYKC